MLMDDWYLIKGKQPTFNSCLENDEFAYYTQDGFEEVLTETPLGKDVLLCRGKFDGSNFEVEIEDKAVIQNDTNDTMLQGETRQCLARIGTLKDYEYIKYDNDIWLIETEPYNNDIYEKSILKLCNIPLRFQDKNSGEILQIPFWIEEATRYGYGITNSAIMQNLDKQYHIKIPYNESTKQLKNGRRFMLEFMDDVPCCYKLTKYEGVTERRRNIRVVNMTLTQTEYNPDTDNTELMLCDYFAPYHEEEIKITYSGENSVRIGGQKTFTCNCGNVVWEIKSDNFNTDDYLVTNINGNKITVKCKYNETLFDGKYFTLTASDNSQEQSIIINLQGGV